MNLEELWLGKNKITRLEVCHPISGNVTTAHHVQNLDALKRLKILSIQSNRITKLEGLEHLESLEEVYLSHNGIERLEGLEHNVSEPIRMSKFV